MCALMLFAGHETTTSTITSAVLTLLRNPEQLALLEADPGAGQERRRGGPALEGAIKVLHRWVIEDLEIRGRKIAKGDRVLLIPAAANRDPEKFPDPDRVDITRSPNLHVAFGRGIHACIGAQLARMEMRRGGGAASSPGCPGLRLADPSRARTGSRRWPPARCAIAAREAMTKVDVVVIGAGAAGLSAAALLAKEGKKVAVVEAGRHLGGRGMAVPEEGFKLNLGGHLLEDSGSGITKIFDYVGKKLEHGAVSSDMPVWDHVKERWGSIRDRYSGDKSELKKVIRALGETPYEELDDWDDRPLREWMHQHTRDQGVIDLWEFLSVLECMTDNWYDHSASDNLYVRKMHYGETRMAGYSFWPGQGWDGLFQDLHDAVIEHGGEVLMGTPVETVVIEDSVVKGVMLGRDKVLPNEIFEGEVLEADAVISTLPVWNVLRVVPESELPDWYAAQIKYVAQDHLRISWLGLYLATHEPVCAIDPREIATWLHAPKSRLSGFFFNMTAMDPTTSPEGTNLFVAGGIIPGEKARDMGYVKRNARAVRGRPEDDVPGAQERLLAPPPPGPRPVVRRHPEARPGRPLPPALARAQRRGPVLRLGDVPLARHRRRPRRPRRPDRGRGLPRPPPGRRLRLALLTASAG